jgi:hypothetical protein
MQVRRIMAYGASLFLIHGSAVANEKLSAEKPFKAACPLMLSGVNIKLKEPFPDWTSFVSEPIRLEGIAVTAGSDKDTTAIVPSKIVKKGNLITSTLSLSTLKSGQRQLVCKYGAKKLLLSQPLNDQLSTCIIATQTDETKSFMLAQVTCN